MKWFIHLRWTQNISQFIWVIKFLHNSIISLLWRLPFVCFFFYWGSHISQWDFILIYDKSVFEIFIAILLIKELFSLSVFADKMRVFTRLTTWPLDLPVSLSLLPKYLHSQSVVKQFLEYACMHEKASS